MIRIDTERPGDVAAREALLDRCFGRTQRRRKTVETFRRGRLPAAGLSFALRDGNDLLGTVRLWDVVAGDAGPALLLGPIAIAPERQGEGLGQLLMRHALDAARAQGHAAVLLVGDAAYYARFGFSAEAVRDLTLPGPVERTRFVGLAFKPEALANATGPVSAAGQLRAKAKASKKIAA